ncbi:MAG: reverse transcriptase domain-containing protein [Candidatus Poribacteria bacterium]|nr:reverse transcriptase domain-containing protein [Candidatus Poribacteria bacterium]
MLEYTPNNSLATQLYQPETLHTAWRKVRANKGGPGIDGVTIQQFEANLTKHLHQLSRELAEERYYPLPVQKFTMKKSNGSTRELSVLTLKDRIVQRAVCDLISPIYESKFLECSFAYRPNRGVPHAIAQVAAIRAEGYEWAVHADIEKFFDRMDTEVLMRFLRASLKEPAIIRLIQMWLDMGGILQPPKLPTWSTHIENTVHHLGEGVEQVINQLLHRTPNIEHYSEHQNALTDDDWGLDAPEMTTSSGALAQTGKEMLTNLGRDGLILLLANAKRLWKPLATKQLLIIAPLVVAALAAPTVGSIVKERMSRPRKIGIIQGSPLSPLLANIYLHPFDKAMTRAGIRMVRYADDLLLLCRSESRAQHALQHAQKQLATLKLELNPKKTQIADFNTGIEFLGHIFDADGCYQPIPGPRTKILQNQVQRAIKTGAVHVKRSGQHVTQQGKNVVAHIGQRLKNGKTRSINC